MNEIKLIINGKEVKLTEEQIKALDLALRRKLLNPFERVKRGEEYYCIKETGEIYSYGDDRGSFDGILYAESNYFNDKQFANQVALRRMLYRKLLKFAYDNEYEDTAGWNETTPHWTIRYNADLNKFFSYCQDGYKTQGVYFSTSRGAERAIEEVIKPFIKEHPEFVW